MTAGEEAAAPVPLRRNRNFQLLWIGQVLSGVGFAAARLAYPLLILALTHSAVIAGAVGTVVAVAQFCLRLPAGALSDRLDRRRTMIVCDSVRAVLLALLGVLVLAHLISWPFILAIALLEQGAEVIFDPAANAALPVMVADAQLEEAWAATEGREYAASLIGPALGGALFGLARSIPFLGDAVSYLVSAGTASRLRGRFRPPEGTERKALWREAGEGVRLVWREPLLRMVLLQVPLVNFTFSGVMFTIILALRRHGTEPSVIGLVEAGVSAGGLLGALAAARLQKRLSLSRLVVVVSLAGVAMFAAAALIVPSPLVAVPIAVSFFLAPTANAALFAALLRSTPEELRGRVNNTMMMMATGLASLSPLAAGLLVQRVGGEWALGFFAAVTAVAAVLAIVLPGLREAERAAAARPAGDTADPCDG